MNNLFGNKVDSFLGGRCLAKYISALFSLWIVSQLLASAQAPAQSGVESLEKAKQEVKANPQDAEKRFALAESLKNSGESKQAAIQYLNATVLDPSYYLAYHKLLQCKPTQGQVDEAVDRLNKLEQRNPNELMLRVALSELLEHTGEYYKAARALVDLQYAHGIPAKYATKINSRIRYLLMKTRDEEAAEQVHKTGTPGEPQTESESLPMPQVDFSDDLSVSKLKDSNVTEGYGHTRLLP